MLGDILPDPSAVCTHRRGWERRDAFSQATCDVVSGGLDLSNN